jgi:hypothetical protein
MRQINIGSSERHDRSRIEDMPGSATAAELGLAPAAEWVKKGPKGRNVEEVS